LLERWLNRFLFLQHGKGIVMQNSNALNPAQVNLFLRLRILVRAYPARCFIWPQVMNHYVATLKTFDNLLQVRHHASPTFLPFSVSTEPIP
jgi:hypothetical protein